MAFLPTNASQVQQFAVALYGIKVGSTTMAAVQADILAVGGLTKALNAYYAVSFGSQTTAAVAASVAANLGLTGTAATDGAAYITAALNAAPATARGQVISDILNLFSTLTSNATYGAAAAAWNTKVAVAVAYTGASDAVVVAGAEVTGGEFNLTTSVDTGSSLPGTAYSDTFYGVDSGTDTADTINTGDFVSGGAGADTLQLILADNDGATFTTSSVETIQVTSTQADTTNTTFVANNWSGVTKVLLKDTGTQDAVQNTLTLTGLQNNVTLALQNVAVESDNDLVLSAAFASNKLGGATATLTIDTNVAGDSSQDAQINVDAAGSDVFKTLQINATGANYIYLDATDDADVALSTINVTGTGSLTLTADGTDVEFTSVTNVDASANSGGLTLDLGTSAAATTVTGGSGADVITAVASVNYTINTGAGNDTVTASDGAGDLTSFDSINGGDGTDTLLVVSAEAAALDDGDATDAAVLAKVVGFEILGLTDALNNTTTDIANLGYNYLRLDADLTGDETVSGFTSGATIELRNAASETDALIVGMTGATAAGSTTDAITIKLNANLTANDTSYTKSFDLQGINIVNIVANDRVTSSNPDTDADGQEGYVVDLADGTAAHSSNINTVNISGAAQVSYTVNAATTGLTKIDGASATGNIVANADAYAGTEGVTINTGSGKDTVTGSDLGDVISTGAGNDSITPGTGVDVMTGGAGTDTYVVVAADWTAATAATLAVAADSITDYANGVDVIDWDATVSVVQNATATAGTAKINSEGLATFAAADDTLAERITAVEAAIVAGTNADGAFAFFEFGSDTYVFISEGTDGVGAGDAVIKLVGVTGLTDSTVNADNNLVLA